MNKYERAAEVRERGLLGNITDNLISGGGSITGGIGRGISDTFKAKVTGVKEKFDPLNIAKKMTGGVGVGILGRMMGRSKSDMSYFANKGKDGGLLGRAFSALKPKGKLGGVDTALYANISDGSRNGLKKNDSLANVGAKLYNAMKTSYDVKKLERELDKDFSKENAAEDKRRHEEFIDAIEKSKKKAPEPKKTKKEVEKQTKKAEPAAPAPAPKAEPGKAAAPAPAPKTTAKPAESTAPKTEPAKAPEPKTEPAKAPAPAPKSNVKTKAKRAEPTAPKTTAKPAESTAPKTEPAKAPAPTATKAPVSTAAKTAAKVGVAVSAADAIGGAETGGNYDLSYGDVFNKKAGKTINIAKDPKTKKPLNLKTPEEYSGKKLTEMTLAEVKAFGEYRSKNGAGAGAVGKYQFMPSTLFGSKKGTGLVQQLMLKKPDVNMNTKFTPALQDELQQLLHTQDVKTLKRLGVPITPGYEYMAHYIGAGGAAAVYNSIKKGEDKTVAEVMSDHNYDIGNNAELLEIKAADFEGILASRLEKKGGMSPHSSASQELQTGNKVDAASKTLKNMQQTKVRLTVISDSSTTAVVPPGGKRMTLTNPTQQDRPAYQQ
jgi:hypothetical protein